MQEHKDQLINSYSMEADRRIIKGDSINNKDNQHNMNHPVADHFRVAENGRSQNEQHSHS